MGRRGSSSQRFLTALFPFFLIGTAEFVRRTRWPGVVLLTLCACFSVWIGLVQANGYYGESASDGVDQIVEHYQGFTGPKISRYHAPPPGDSIQNFWYHLTTSSRTGYGFTGSSLPDGARPEKANARSEKPVDRNTGNQEQQVRRQVRV